MASEKILESKKAKVAALTEKLQNSVSFVLVDYKGITVEEDTKLRKELREAGVSYTVEKNSMLRFALKMYCTVQLQSLFLTMTRLLLLVFWASSQKASRKPST